MCSKQKGTEENAEIHLNMYSINMRKWFLLLAFWLNFRSILLTPIIGSRSMLSLNKKNKASTNQKLKTSFQSIYISMSLHSWMSESQMYNVHLFMRGLILLSPMSYAFLCYPSTYEHIEYRIFYRLFQISFNTSSK